MAGNDQVVDPKRKGFGSDCIRHVTQRNHQLCVADVERKVKISEHVLQERKKRKKGKRQGALCTEVRRRIPKTKTEVSE